jgi:hypothetical protein
VKRHTAPPTERTSPPELPVALRTLLVDVLSRRLLARLTDAGLVPAVEPTREVGAAHDVRATDVVSRESR